MKRVLVTLAVVFGILMAAAACGVGQSSPASLSSRTSTGSNGGSTYAPVKGVPDQSVGGGTVTNPTDTLPAIQGPQVIRQAQLSITVGSGSFDSKLADVRRLVQLQGGFIAGTDAQANPVTNDQIRTGVITFMVPAAKFDDTIDQLAKMGKVQNEHITGQDVSAQYVDLQARLANAQAQRDAMLALLKRAQSVSDIIAVQTQLGQITGQIEQLKGQIAYLDKNTAYSSVSVSLVEAGAPTSSPAVDSWGFVSALSDAAHNFVTTVNYLISGLGAIGPIAILLGLGYLLWRRRDRLGLRHA